jgi:glutamate dehydrogenase/leucine dehydrogenase
MLCNYHFNMITPVDIVKLHDALKSNGIFGKPSMAIAGFSSKSMQIGEYARKAGFRVVAVSDESCGIIDLGGNGGLDINELLELRKKYKDFKSAQLNNIRKTDPEFLSKIEVDVLIVEFLEADMAEEVRAKVVLELGGGMISREASRVLETKLIPVISPF